MELKELVPWHWHRTPAHNKHSFEQAIDSLHREFDRMFEDFWHGHARRSFAPALWGFDGAVPAIDETEDEKAFYVNVEVPGVDEKDVELTFADNVLTIRGEKKMEKEQEEKNYYLRERAQGAFRRSISFPAEIDENKVKAEFKNGVLTVTLPKTKEAQKKAKRIAITSNQA